MKNSVVIKNPLGFYEVIWSNLQDVFVVKKARSREAHICVSHQVLTGKSNGGPCRWWRRGEARATIAEEVRASPTTEDQSPEDETSSELYPTWGKCSFPPCRKGKALAANTNTAQLIAG